MKKKILKGAFLQENINVNDSKFLRYNEGQKTYCASAKRGEPPTVNSIPKETMLMNEGKMETFSDEEK